MSTRAHGIALSYELDKTTVTEKKVGQLVTQLPSGLFSTELDDTAENASVLVEDVNSGDNSVSITEVGVAMAFVEDASGIVAGSKLGIGSNGLGVTLYTSGAVIGFARAVPRGNGDLIPVLIHQDFVNQLY